MAFDIQVITKSQADAVINIEEGQYTDAKAIEKKPSSLPVSLN